MSFLLLPLIAALAVWVAGRRDASCDPRLTTLALALLAAAPLFPLLPKVPLLPVPGAGPGTPGGGHWLLLVWAAGSAVALMNLAAGLVRLGAWRRRSTAIGFAPLPGSRRAGLRLLPGLSSPVAAGILRPVVYLPTNWPVWSPATRDAVLAHELAHLACRDPLRKLLAALACAIHWFNPLVHWMARRLDSQCEFASDSRVLAAGHPAADYAHLLCDLAETRRLPFGALAMARRSGLEQRVRHMLAEHPPHGRWVLGALIASTLVTAIGLAILGPAAPTAEIPASEARLRLSADPFPGN